MQSSTSSEKLRTISAKCSIPFSEIKVDTLSQEAFFTCSVESFCRLHLNWISSLFVFFTNASIIKRNEYKAFHGHTRNCKTFWVNETLTYPKGLKRQRISIACSDCFKLINLSMRILKKTCIVYAERKSIK